MFQNHRYAPSPRHLNHYPPTHHRSNFLVFDSNTYRHPSSSNIVNNVDSNTYRHDTINQYEYSITDDLDSNDEMLQATRQQLLLMGYVSMVTYCRFMEVIKTHY
jgi:hypothetical protein